jgi:hypothetical protein
VSVLVSDSVCKWLWQLVSVTVSDWVCHPDSATLRQVTVCECVSHSVSEWECQSVSATLCQSVCKSVSVTLSQSVSDCDTQSVSVTISTTLCSVSTSFSLCDGKWLSLSVRVYSDVKESVITIASRALFILLFAVLFNLLFIGGWRMECRVSTGDVTFGTVVNECAV